MQRRLPPLSGRANPLKLNVVPDPAIPLTPPFPQATYAGPWHLKPFATVTRNPYGQGQAWYVGTVMKEPAFYDALIAQLLKDANVRPVVTPPPGVEVALRQSPTKKLLFLINHTEESKAVRVPEDTTGLLTGQKTGDSLNLNRFAVTVLEL